ncbi:hypothetical protein FRB94_007591 [Tulasnella sp. JGI-2019a]|nr:hypothetical protein FRB94_007591 [Tulasnella sp. JGI-2019a]KAG9006970.1 hypothetical protein FRB93_008236 [Tulasnella sp. JGI-2019a]KAG9024287.1 hypothetical protein FRB95_011718 [Tulasnella sp. JGI-2019a]
MFPSRAALSKASRFPLTSKRGNKDYYKGTRAAALPGGHRTGAPGKHVVGGKAKYRLIDEKVRYFVAPSIEDIVNSPLKPYVHVSTVMPDKAALYGKLPRGGFNGEHYLKIAKAASDGTTSFTEEPQIQKQ